MSYPIYSDEELRPLLQKQKLGTRPLFRLAGINCIDYYQLLNGRRYARHKKPKVISDVQRERLSRILYQHFAGEVWLEREGKTCQVVWREGSSGRPDAKVRVSITPTGARLQLTPKPETPTMPKFLQTFLERG